MIHFTKISFIMMILIGLISCEGNKQIDLIVHNAKIYTINENFDIAEAMAINKGKIIAIGAENEILNKYEAKINVDAKKRPIYPGFIDAHCHFVGYALNLTQVNLVGTKSFKEVIERVKKFAKTNHTKWIIGRGWDQNDWESKKFPTNKELNKLFPNQPVFLTRIDGHAALANNIALKLANINYKTKVDGGIITLNTNKKNLNLNKELNKNINTQLTGLLIDNAIDLVKKVIPPPTKKTLTAALLYAQNKLFKVGLTTVDDAGLTKDTIDLIDKLQQENKLKLKIYAMISATPTMLKYYLKKGIYKTDKLSVRSFKFYADGALGSRGACLLKPYTDVKNKNYYGLLLHPKSFFEKYAPLIYAKGFQMNTHCIGDSANRIILNIYAKTLKKTNDKRWRIEHAQIIDSNDFKKFKQFNIIPSVQPTHATSDMYWAKNRLGNKRIKNAYAYKKLLQQNGLLALGTDFPVENINPINTFFAAVFRKDTNRFPANGFQTANAISRKDALKGMTIWAAIANFEENEKGSLVVGKYADFVILDDDIITTDEQDILKTKVLKTFINGKQVYNLSQ